MITTARRLAVFAALALGAAALSACGGGNGSKTSTPGGTSAAGSPAGATSEATQSAGGNGAGSAELADVAQKFASSTFQATYKTSGSGSEGLFGGQLVLYKDGQQRFRFDASITQDGQATDVIFITTESVSAFCLKDVGELGGLLGIAPGQGVCFKSDPNDPNNPVAGLSSIFQDLETTNTTLLDKSSRTVAGKDTTCYRMKDNSTAEISTACFTSDGVLMSTSTEGSDAFTMEATVVSGSVSAGAFDLPYELRDLPNLGG